jgi:uracil-DNA glycosylase family 4
MEGTVGKGLKTLAQEWHGCQRCSLGSEREGMKIVFGDGARRAKFLLLYDVPTAHDAALGAPMSGREGEVLLELLEHAGIAIHDVYCTPLLGCRPVLLLPETADQQAQIADRAPAKEELAACSPRVQEIIYRVDPLVIFTLGDLAWKALVKPKGRGQHTSLDKALGYIFSTTVPGRWIKEVPYSVVPLLSMKQVISQPSYASHGPLHTTARHLHKGRVYAEFLEKAGQRDAKAAGYESEVPQP